MAQKDYAPGLPSKKRYGDLSKLRAGQFVDFIVQRHKAERAGEHYDVRLGTPETGLFSWATKKELPKPGERRALFQQPLHRHEYGQFEGEIAEGYGKGTVEKAQEGRLFVTKITPKSIHFSMAHKKVPERFVLLSPRPGRGESPEKGNSKQWLLLNTTPTKPVPYNKVHYKKVSPEKAEAVLDNLQPGSSVQAKIDGAAALVKLMEDKAEIMSYRVAKQTGHPIIHTERVFKGPATVSIQKEYVGTVLRTELYGTRNGKTIPPQELGGILNSALEKSVETQKERGIELKNLVFDIQNIGKKSTKGLPYAKRMEIIKELISHLPSSRFGLPEEATTPEAAKKLLKRIGSGKEPLTHEGIVIHPAEGKPSKVKFMDEHDVHITGFFPAEGKYKDRAIGGFTYALKPDGPTVGKVGTGFSDELRRDMYLNPQDYIGRVAKIRAQDQHKSGAFRAPALLSLHEDYPTRR
jgi:hypothetical protein